MNERQEIYCHSCGKWVQFDIDISLDGNHILKCPNCGHEHCRVVKNGVITGDRWDSRNGQTFIVSASTVTTSAKSVFSLYSSTSTAGSSSFGAYALYDSWTAST